MPLVPSCAVAGRTTPQQTKQSDESDLSTLRTHCAALADTRCGNSSGRTLDETQAENVHKKHTHLQEAAGVFFLFFFRKQRTKAFFFFLLMLRCQRKALQSSRVCQKTTGPAGLWVGLMVAVTPEGGRGSRRSRVTRFSQSCSTNSPRSRAMVGRTAVTYMK